LTPKGVGFSVLACLQGDTPEQVAAWEQQAWQRVSVQVDEETHRPRSLSASLPEAVLPAEMQPAVQLAVAVAEAKQTSASALGLFKFKLDQDKSCIVPNCSKRFCASKMVRFL